MGSAKKLLDRDLADLAKSAAKANIGGLLFGAVAGASAAAAAGVIAITKATASYADEMGKAAQKTGIGVRELSGLRHAAEMSDVSFSDLQTGLKIFAKTTDGPLGESLRKMSDKFQSMPDGVEKSRLAVEKFGRSGTMFIPFLNDGAAGLAKMAKEAEIFGTVVDEKLAKQGDELGDNLDNVWNIVKGLGITLGRELVPVVSDLVGSFVEWYKVNADVIQQNVAGLATSIADGFKLLGETAQWASPILGFLGNRLVEIGQFVLVLKDFFKIGLQGVMTVLASALEPIVEMLAVIVHPFDIKARMEMVKDFEFFTAAMSDITKETVDKSVESWGHFGEDVRSVQSDTVKHHAKTQEATTAKELSELLKRWHAENDFYTYLGELASAQLREESERQEAISAIQAEYAERRKAETAAQERDHFDQIVEANAALSEYVSSTASETAAEEIERARERELAEYEWQLDQAKKFNLDVEAIEKAHSRRSAALDKQEMANKVQAWQATLNTLGSMFGALAAAQDTSTKEGFEKSKKMRIAEAIMSTLSGSIAAYTAMVGIPYVGPYLAVIAAAAALVAGYANVSKIRKQQWNGGSAAGGADFVPEDQTMMIHRGEAIVPANPAARMRRLADALGDGSAAGVGGMGGGGGPMALHVTLDVGIPQLLRVLSAEVRDRDGQLIASSVKGTARGI